MSTDGEASHTIEASHSSSSSSSAAASGASFHFSPSASTAFGNASTSPLHSPTSPITSNGTSPLVTPDFQTAAANKHLSPFAEGAPVSSLRPFAGRQVSFPTEGTQVGGIDDDVDRPRRVSNEPERTGAGAWPSSPLTSPADLWQPPSNRSTRASSDGVVQDGIGDAFERRAFVSPTSSVLSVRQGPTDYMTAKGNVTPSSISAALSPTSTTSQLPSLSPTFSSHLDSKSVGSPRGSPSILVTGFEPGLPESEILTFFKSLFPSTLVAQLLHDATARAGEGYAIVHFGEESDVIRALTLGQTNGSGLLLHGRPVRMSRVGSHHDMGNDSAMPSGLSTPYSSHDTRQSPFVSTTALDGSSAPLSPSAPQFSSTPLPSASRTSDAPSGPAMSRIVPPTANVPASSDPNNTTVFVGGLPACISEETLKSFFQHFGDITYCKIPPGKGCGFVQFVHRHDAEMAIAKMNDFPIHGKSRIRLSWGRSQGDKQIEHVRKLASALGVPFDAVWKMVQGQDSANGRPTARSLSHDVGAMPGRHDSASRRDAQSAAQRQSIRRELESSTSRSNSSGPYARVPQTNFMHGNGQPSLFMPLSPPPSGSSLGSFQQQQQHAQAHLQRQSQHPHGLNYNNVRHDGYSLDGGTRATRNDRYGYEFEPQFGQYSGNDYDAGFDDGFAPKHSAIESGMSQLSLDPSSYSNGLQGFAGHLPQAMYKDDSSRLYDSAHWGP